MDCFTVYCLPGLVPVPRLGKKSLVKCHMSASQVLNARTYYTTLAANNALPDPTFCNHWKPIAFHKCRSRQIVGGAQGFAPISRNLPEKSSKENDLKNMTAFHSILGAFFSNQSTSSTIFPQISPKLAQISPHFPEKELKIHDLQKKKRLHLDFGRHFWNIEALKAILRRFSHILPKFTQIRSKFLGVGFHPLHPHLLHHWS